MIPIIVFDDRHAGGFRKGWSKLVGPVADENYIVLAELGTTGSIRQLVAKAGYFLCIIVHYSWFTAGTKSSLSAAVSFARREGKAPIVIFVTNDGFAKPKTGSLDESAQKEVVCLYSRVHFPSDANIEPRVAKTVTEFLRRLFQSLGQLGKHDGNNAAKLERMLEEAERGVPNVHINSSELTAPPRFPTGTATTTEVKRQTGQPAQTCEEHCFRFWLLVHYARITMRKDQPGSAFRSAGLWMEIVDGFSRCNETGELRNASLLAKKVMDFKKREGQPAQDIVLLLENSMGVADLSALLERAESEMREKASFA
jgi:hypothetical protein